MTDKLIRFKSIKTKRTKVNKRWMKSRNGWRSWLLVGELVVGHRFHEMNVK